MRALEVYHKGILAGVLIERSRKDYVFRYDHNYFLDTNREAISLTFPKIQREFMSSFLFPFFANMLSEGVNRKLQSVQLKIDENDDFALLIATAQADTIGAITVKPVEYSENKGV